MPKRKKEAALLVTLPNGTFNFVSFEKDGTKKLEAVYQDMRMRDPSLPPADSIYAADRRGNEIDLHTLVKDLSDETAEIAFLSDQSEIISPTTVSLTNGTPLFGYHLILVSLIY